MPVWSDAPPDETRGHCLPLLRCPTGKPLVAWITSQSLIGCPTHFYHGRTAPCEGETCEPCREGVPWRWHGYFTAYSTTDHLHFLFEVTARAAEPLIKFRDEHAVLRGCHFKAQRANLAPNSRVFIECKMGDLLNLRLPDPPDLVKLLSVIWNLPAPEIQPADEIKGAPAIKVVPGNNRLDNIMKPFSPAP